MRAILFPALASSVLAFTAFGCGGDTESADGPVDQVPAFEGGTGQTAHGNAVYPEGPYGVEVGTTIENFKFIGYPNPTLDQANFYEIQLSDFYNPTGSDVYPEGSLYGAGNLKPTVLMISVASVWCGPCNYESDQVLPGEHLKYHPDGAEFLLQLADGPTAGQTAEFKHLKNWTTKYDTNWPAVIDPAYKLSALFAADAFPQNFLVDTTTMEILEVIAGVPEEGSSFYDTLEAHLRK